MTVYERVETEYSHILLQKDQQIQDQNERLDVQEKEIISLHRQLDEEQEARSLEREAEQVRERKRALADKEFAQALASNNQEREMRLYRERLDQDLEFRTSQLEARYQQATKQFELDLQSQFESTLREKEQDFETRLKAEAKRQQDEQAKQHALTTQQIYDDVSRTLKDEQKRMNRHLKQEMEEKYQEKMKALDNEH